MCLDWITSLLIVVFFRLIHSRSILLPLPYKGSKMKIYIYICVHGIQFMLFGLSIICKWKSIFNISQMKLKSDRILYILHIKNHEYMLFKLHLIIWSNYFDFLQNAFSSTPLFEPFVIPLLLQKLSSSLHSAKVGFTLYFILSICITTIVPFFLKKKP